MSTKYVNTKCVDEQSARSIRKRDKFPVRWAGGGTRFIVSLLAVFLLFSTAKAEDYFALSTGVSGAVNAIVFDNSGNLYAGGDFTQAGGVTVNRVAKWNGSNWSSLGTGINSSVTSLAVDKNSNLYAGGWFTQAGGIATNYVAKWNGTTWSALGTGMPAYVNALVVDSAGNLYAGGGNSTTGFVAKWNGSTWTTIGNTNVRVYSLAFDNSGNLYAGGSFLQMGGNTVSYIAKWNGSTWSAVGNGINNQVMTLKTDKNGTLYAGGAFTQASGTAASYVAKWDGSAWRALDTGMNNRVTSLTVSSGNVLYAGGQFTQASGQTVNYLTKWDGSAWKAISSGTNIGASASVYALAFNGQDHLYLGGNFVQAGGQTVSKIALVKTALPSLAKLDVTKTGSGTITSTPAGISCDTDCTEDYALNTQVTLTATVATGSTFLGWGGACSGTSSCQVTMSQAQNVTANFNVIPQVLLSVTKTGTGTGEIKSSDNLVNCGTACQGGYAINSAVTLTATPATNSTFAGWSGACSGTTNSCKVGMSQAKTVTASFNALVAKISITPTTYDFEDLNVGSSLLPQTLTVSNTGNGNLQVSAVTLTNSTDFSLSGNCAGQTLAPSQTCAIQVTPSPKSVGLKESTISIASNAPNSTVSVKVNGVSIQRPLIPLSSDVAGQGNTTVSPVLKSSKVTQNDVMSCGKWVPVGFGVKEPYGLDFVTVTATAYDKNNNLLYVGGSFKTATDKEGDKLEVNGIAKWNPVTETWSPLGSGVSGTGSQFYVTSLAVDNSGNLYAGGFFTHAGGVLVNRVAKWNGSAWSKLGDGFSAEVASLAIHPTTGVLYAAGQFTTSGITSVNSRVAKFENGAWKKVGTKLTDVEFVHSIIFDKNGQLYVSGKFTIAIDGDEDYQYSDVAKLASNGIGWEPLADSIGKTWDYGPNGAIALASDGKGNLYTGGDFSITNSNPYSTVARKIAMNNTAADNQAKWTGLTKYGLNNLVVALAVDGENNLYAGGTFSSTDDFSPNYPYYTPVKRVAKWDGTKWNPLGDGLSGENGSVVQSLAFDGSSNLYAGGTFDLPGGSNIAKWVDCVKPCPQPATIESVGTGSWVKDTTWWDTTMKKNRIPNPNDVVLIKKGHTITGQYNTALPTTVNGLCNYGTIQSGSQWVKTGEKCVDWGWFGNLFNLTWRCKRKEDTGYYGSTLNLTASSFMNNYGTIQRVSSNSDTITLKTSGAFSNYPGAKLSGDWVNVSAKQIANYGASGALGRAEMSIVGGWVTALATKDFTNYGNIFGSYSGPGNGVVKVSGLPFYNNGTISAKTVYLDPQLLSLLEDSMIEAEEVVIVGGDNAVLDLSGLKENAIVTKKLTIAVGTGGSVDLTGTPANAIQATEVKVFADNIVLDEGKQLTDSINTANVTVEPAKILYDVSIISPDSLAGKMGEVLPVNIAIANTGPKLDTYNINVSSKLGWNITGVSPVMTVETHEQGELAFNIALPVIAENEQGEDILTVTATSQSDPTVSHSFDIKVVSAKQILETTIDETTGKLMVTDEAGNLVEVDQLIKESEEKANSQTLIDENGNPMPGVTIQINDQTFVTDENGNWTMPQLPEGNHTITVSKDGKVLSSTKVNVGSDGEIIDSKPVETGDRTAHGTLRDDQGNPIAGVTIDIDGKTTTTDALGNWQINGLVDETTYTVTASKDGYTFAPTTVDIGNETVMTEVNIEPLTTLKLTAKPSTWGPIGQGENLTYTFTLTNGGQHTATGITLTEQLPKGATLVSMTAAEGTCDLSNLICTLPDLAPGSNTTVSITFKASEGGNLKNVATLNSAEYPVDVQTSWKVVKPYLSVTITDSPDPVQMLKNLHYTLNVELSPVAPVPTATGIKVVTQLPKGVELQQLSTDQGSCRSDQHSTITCELDELSVASPEKTSQARVEMDLQLKDAGLLMLTMESKISSNEYPSSTTRERSSIFVPPDFKVDMAIVIDTTGSMQGEINGLFNAAKKFLQAQVSSEETPTIALIDFKDDVKVLALSKDHDVILNAIKGMKAEGGGLCPEASAEAIEIALNHVKEGGSILLATDASPYDDADIESLLSRLQAQKIRFNAIISGDCTDKKSWN